MLVDTSEFRRAFKKSLPFYAIAGAGVLFFLIFRYVPMFGIIIAFKDPKISDRDALDRGRDTGCPAPPARIRTCALTHTAPTFGG